VILLLLLLLLLFLSMPYQINKTNAEATQVVQKLRNYFKQQNKLIGKRNRMSLSLPSSSTKLWVKANRKHRKTDNATPTFQHPNKLVGIVLIR